jgi:hypothetical protein
MTRFRLTDLALNRIAFSDRPQNIVTHRAADAAGPARRRPGRAETVVAGQVPRRRQKTEVKSMNSGEKRRRG